MARLGTKKWGILKYLSAEISFEKSEIISDQRTCVSGVLGQKLGYDTDVHWTPPFNGLYKLNVDAVGPIEGDKWGIGVMVRDNEGVVVGASSWQVFLLPISEVAKALAIRKGLKFAKGMCFLNLIA